MCLLAGQAEAAFAVAKAQALGLAADAAQAAAVAAEHAAGVATAAADDSGPSSLALLKMVREG